MPLKLHKIFGRPAKLWTERERATLRRLWPTACKQEILAEIQHRKWSALRHQAHKMGVKRTYREVSTKASPRAQVLRDLVAARMAADMSQSELALVIGVPGQRVLSRMEGGKRGVSVAMLAAWCGALGMELRAVRVGEPMRRKVAKVVRLKDRLRDQAAADMAAWRRGAA